MATSEIVWQHNKLMKNMVVTENGRCIHVLQHIDMHIFWGDDDDDISGCVERNLSVSMKPDMALSHLVPKEKVLLFTLDHPRHPAGGLPVVAS
jgi:hypothetical protein